MPNQNLLYLLKQECASLLREKHKLEIRLQEINDELIQYRQATQDPNESDRPSVSEEGEGRLDLLSNGTRQDGSDRNSLCSQPGIQCPDEDDSWPGTVYAVDN